MTTDDRLTVYLAGPVRGPNALWRRDFEEALGHLRPSRWPLLIHPGANIPGAADAREANGRTDLFVAADILSIERADLLVAFLRAEESGRGTGFELGYASSCGTRILPVATSDEDRSSWAFALGNVPFVYRSLGDAAAVVAYAAAQLAGARYNPELPG